jgi:heparosan-N-sulfate-glucuronate 5-epimerase
MHMNLNTVIFFLFCFITIIILLSLPSIDINYIAYGITFDKNKIPLYDYGTIKGEYIGNQYNPIDISHKSDKFYNDYINNGNKTAKQYFLKYINWLLDNSIKTDNYSFIVYNYSFPVYNLKPPWFSAMAQGEVIPRFLNAYQITGDKIYLINAKNALNVLFIEIHDACRCGVTYKIPEKGWWYEEYPNVSGNGPKVLNGMMFTLLDVYKYYNFTKNPSALYLFNQGKKGLINEINNYDKNGTYSSYDKYHGYAPIGYHKIHVCLLDKLYDVTKETIFKNYYNKWVKNIPVNQLSGLLNKDTCS